MAKRKNPYGHVKRGYRDDIPGSYFRSAWEANYARILKLLESEGVISGWEYEPQKFYFTDYGYRRGPWVYTPDFAVFVDDKVQFTEVKGRETGTDRQKWKRFRKHTDYELVVVKEKDYLLLEATYAARIPEWEYSTYKLKELREAG